MYFENSNCCITVDKLVTVNKEYLYAWILQNPFSVQLKELDFIIFKLKNDHEATVFKTWHRGQKICRMLKSSAYQNPGDGALSVLE